MRKQSFSHDVFVLGVFLNIALLLGVVGLVSCGGAQSSPERYYLLSDGLRIRFLSLREIEGKQQLSGTDVEAWYDAPLSELSPSDPATVQNGVTGTWQDTHIQLTVGGGLGWKGTRQPTYLDITMLDPSGLQVQRRWYEVADMGTYNQILTLFRAHIHTRLTLLDLEHTETYLPLNSDSKEIDNRVSGTRKEVDFLVSAWETVKGAKDRCQALKERLLPFYPLPQKAFSLPTWQESAIAQGLSKVDQAWKQAGEAKVEHLPKGLTFSWLVTAKDVAQGEREAKTTLKQLQDAITTQTPQMQQLQHTYQSVASQVEPIRQSCGL